MKNKSLRIPGLSGSCILSDEALYRMDYRLDKGALLALVKDEIGRDSPSVVAYADLPNATTPLDFVPPRKYDAVVLVEQVANFGTGLGSLVGYLEATAGAGGNGAGLDSVGTAVRAGLKNARGLNSPVYIAEYTSFESDSALVRAAFPEEARRGKRPEEAYTALLEDAGFSVERISRFDFEGGKLEKNDKSGEYILLKAVPVSK